MTISSRSPKAVGTWGASRDSGNTAFTYGALNRLSGFTEKDSGGTDRVGVSTPMAPMAML